MAIHAVVFTQCNSKSTIHLYNRMYTYVGIPYVHQQYWEQWANWIWPKVNNVLLVCNSNYSLWNWQCIPVLSLSTSFTQQYHRSPSHIRIQCVSSYTNVTLVHGKSSTIIESVYNSTYPNMAQDIQCDQANAGRQHASMSLRQPWKGSSCHLAAPLYKGIVLHLAWTQMSCFHLTNVREKSLNLAESFITIKK